MDAKQAKELLIKIVKETFDEVELEESLTDNGWFRAMILADGQELMRSECRIYPFDQHDKDRIFNLRWVNMIEDLIRDRVISSMQEKISKKKEEYDEWVKEREDLEAGMTETKKKGFNPEAKALLNEMAKQTSEDWELIKEKDIESGNWHYARQWGNPKNAGAKPMKSHEFMKRMVSAIKSVEQSLKDVEGTKAEKTANEMHQDKPTSTFGLQTEIRNLRNLLMKMEVGTPKYNDMLAELKELETELRALRGKKSKEENTAGQLYCQIEATMAANNANKVMLMSDLDFILFLQLERIVEEANRGNFQVNMEYNEKVATGLTLLGYKVSGPFKASPGSGMAEYMTVDWSMDSPIAPKYKHETEIDPQLDEYKKDMSEREFKEACLNRRGKPVKKLEPGSAGAIMCDDLIILAILKNKLRLADFLGSEAHSNLRERPELNSAIVERLRWFEQNYASPQDYVFHSEYGRISLEYALSDDRYSASIDIELRVADRYKQ